MGRAKKKRKHRADMKRRPDFERRIIGYNANGWTDCQWYHDEDVLVIDQGLINCKKFKVNDAFVKLIFRVASGLYYSYATKEQLKSILSLLGKPILIRLSLQKLNNENFKEVLEELMYEMGAAGREEKGMEVPNDHVIEERESKHDGNDALDGENQPA